MALPFRQRILVFGGGEEKAVYELRGHDAQLIRNLKPALVPEPYYCSVYGWRKDVLFCVGYANSTFDAMPQLFSFRNDNWKVEIQ